MQLNRSLADKIDLDPNKTRALIARFFCCSWSGLHGVYATRQTSNF